MRTVRFGFLIVACAGIMVGLSGCFSWYDDAGSNYGNRSVDDASRLETSRAYQTEQQYSMVTHKHSSLTMNQFLSDQVAAMNGVNSSIVMVADNTAYVAILIDGTGTGTNGGSTETNNAGTVRGLYNPADSFNDYADPNKLATGSNSYTTVQYHDQLTHLFKQKIAEKIRSLQPTIADVYISANRDYINKLSSISQEAWKGQDLSPYIAEFDAWSERIFGTMPTIPTQSEQ